MVDPASGDKLGPIVPVCRPHFPADPRGRGAAGVGAQGGLPGDLLAPAWAAWASRSARRPASAGAGGAGAPRGVESYVVDPASGDKLGPIVPVCLRSRAGGAARRPASAGVGGVGVALC